MNGTNTGDQDDLSAGPDLGELLSQVYAAVEYIGDLSLASLLPPVAPKKPRPLPRADAAERMSPWGAPRGAAPDPAVRRTDGGASPPRWAPNAGAASRENPWEIMERIRREEEAAAAAQASAAQMAAARASSAQASSAQMPAGGSNNVSGGGNALPGSPAATTSPPAAGVPEDELDYLDFLDDVAAGQLAVDLDQILDQIDLEETSAAAAGPGPPAENSPAAASPGASPPAGTTVTTPAVSSSASSSPSPSAATPPAPRPPEQTAPPARAAESVSSAEEDELRRYGYPIPPEREVKSGGVGASASNAGPAPSPAVYAPQKSKFVETGWIETAASLEELGARLSGCRNCHLGDGSRRVFRGVGPAGARVFFVLDPPADETDMNGPYPVGGPRLELLRDIVEKDLDMDMGDVYVTPVCKCPVAEEFPPAGPLRHCLHVLYKELELVSPGVALSMGAIAGEVLGGPSKLQLLRQRKPLMGPKRLPLRMTYGLGTMVEVP
ncbi:MAG: hypothetical protein LBP95_00190, partial [Deltaproteobacteria bacterium]|nr:hypothetical protein [Deltaproteobacteria bacterium]